AVNYAYNQGVVVVAAAGNSGNSTPNYPGAYTNAIAVASTDSSNNRSSFSTYGSFVDIAAPGSSIYSTYLNGGYATLSGTSMATPHITGLVAVLFGMNNPNYDTPAEIRTAIETTALDLGSAGWDQYYGYGLAQLQNGLLFNPASVTPTNTPTATPLPQTYYYLRSDSCPTSIAYSWIDATGGTNTGLHSDDNFVAVTLPFTFTFNGQPRATAYISTNGFIAFTSDGPAEYINAAIPNAAAPNEFVAPFWDDLNPFNGGNIYYATIGSAPNRQFVVEWNSVPRYSNEGALTLEAILVESTNEIIFQYNSLNGPNADGRSATIGIEFAGGSAGVQHGYNLTGALSNGLALRFAPASGSTPTPAPTCVPSATPSSTPTHTATHTPTFTATPTPTNTPTNTPTFTATSTPTDTPTPTATFTATNTPTNTATPVPCYTLTLAGNPSGGGAFSWTPSNCAGGKYTEGTVAQITAIASSGYYRFLNWSGDASGTANPVSVTMNADKTVTANFEQSTFGDVPFDHSLYRYIQAVYNGGYTAGCSNSPLLYCPDQILNRAQSAVFVLRGQYGAAYAAPATRGTFGDDWAQGSWGEKWAEGMWASSLTSGCNTNPLLYCPWQNQTRAEASVFYLRIKYGASYSPPAGTGAVFADVTNPGVWYAKWVEQAYADGLLPSCGTDG
ncbi:MAG: S8 family serine peptidase, partial [Chloroflexota bacterium]